MKDVCFKVEITGSFDNEGFDPEAELREWFEGLRGNEDNVRIGDIEVKLTNIVRRNLN